MGGKKVISVDIQFDADTPRKDIEDSLTKVLSDFGYNPVPSTGLEPGVKRVLYVFEPGKFKAETPKVEEKKKPKKGKTTKSKK